MGYKTYEPGGNKYDSSNEAGTPKIKCPRY